MWLISGARFQLNAQSTLLSSLSGVAITCCSLLFIRANQLEHASRVAQIDFLQVVFGYAMDFVFFGVALTKTEWVGLSILVALGLLLFYITLTDEVRDADEDDHFYVALDLSEVRAASITQRKL